MTEGTSAQLVRRAFYVSALIGLFDTGFTLAFVFWDSGLEGPDLFERTWLFLHLPIYLRVENWILGDLAANSGIVTYVLVVVVIFAVAFAITLVAMLAVREWVSRFSKQERS